MYKRKRHAINFCLKVYLQWSVQLHILNVLIRLTAVCEVASNKKDKRKCRVRLLVR